VFQFRCPRLRHPFKAEFGNAVGAPAWVTDLAGVASYVDDRTAALDHRRQGVLYQQKWADQICIEDSAEIFDRIIEQVWHRRRPNGGGIVHEHVEMAFELGQGCRDNTLDVARLAHIGLDCDDVCLRREFARVIANLAPLIAVSGDRKSTRLNSSHRTISYAVFCLKKKKKNLPYAQILTSETHLLAINDILLKS